MWIMTSFGIFMPSLRPEEHVPAGDERKLQIRARRERELRILISEYMPDRTAADIVHLPFTDYEFRVYCTHAEWAQVMAKLAMDIDYVKFKDTTSRWNDAKLHTAYLRIWSTLYDMFSTNRTFDVKVKRTKKSKKRGRTTETTEVLFRDYDYEPRKNWWDEVPPIDINDHNWEK